jgi:hypothetical protein
MQTFLNEAEVMRAVQYYMARALGHKVKADALQVTVHWRTKKVEVEIPAIPVLPPLAAVHVDDANTRQWPDLNLELEGD